ncbi:hypothetical protein LCGC14_1422320 [marine sediment metagenome]|uniref:Type 1 periplasmic binding fold superfamily protein n=2 Tax=root TaxID=1 RepID=A0A831QQV2_9FLAO|nr:type 1 periplasmic binding fold superfamily protein [Pricia antarctica]
MKILKIAAIPFLTALLSTACSSDDNGNIPEIVNEEEVITTMTVTLSPEDNGADIILSKTDLDGDGPNMPVFNVSGNLTSGTTYTGSIELLNETVTPAENITDEVKEESEEHQLFYTSDDNLDVTTVSVDNDSDGNLLGTEFTLTAGAASTGTLTFTLRHEPKKPNDGTLTDAAGETDAEASFSITVE